MSRFRPRGPTELERRLTDVRLNQGEKRTRIHPSTESTELRAVSRLAKEIFGELGVVEFGPGPGGLYAGGPISISYFIEPPVWPPKCRPRRAQVVFSGSSIAELVEQVRVWRAAQR